MVEPRRGTPGAAGRATPIATPRRRPPRGGAAMPTCSRCSRRSPSDLGTSRGRRAASSASTSRTSRAPTQAVAAMVTFIDGVPAKNYYRRFQVRTVEQQRLRLDVQRGAPRAAFAAPSHRGSTSRASTTTRGASSRSPRDRRRQGPARDGGRRAHRSRRPARGRVGASRVIEARQGARGSRPGARPIVSTAATSRTRSRCARIRRRLVLARIRDEAHRFANTFHRDRRSKSTLRSEVRCDPRHHRRDAAPAPAQALRQRACGAPGDHRRGSQKAPGMNRRAAEAVATAYFASLVVPR